MYSARETNAADRDLYIVTRESLDDEFEDATPLPRGPGLINSPSDERDAFITSDGELLFASDRDGSPRIYRVPL